MRIRSAIAAAGAALVLSTGCGGSSASVSNLRCDTPCQDVADPFLLRMIVDYDDPEGQLPRGALVVDVDRQASSTYQLESLVEPGKTSGSVKFPVALRFGNIKDGQTFDIRVHATDGAGTDTGEESLEFRIHL